MDENGQSAVSLLPFIQLPQAMAVSSSSGKAAGPSRSKERPSQGDLRATAIPKGPFFRTLKWRRTSICSRKLKNIPERDELRVQGRS